MRGLFGGALLGAAAGVFFAPQITAALRKCRLELTGAAIDAGDAATEGYREAAARVGDAVDDLQQKGRGAVGRALGVVVRGAEEVKERASSAQAGLLTLCLMLAALSMLSTASVSAQEPAAPFVSSIVKGVLLDPTTYAPAVTRYGAMRLDWASSRVFFQHGFLEQNDRYTLSGISDTAAIGRRAGNLKIAKDSLGTLQLSIAHNLTSRIVERQLTQRFPTHGKLIRVVARIERIAASSYLSFALSAAHFRQWRKNDQLARELGYR